MNPFDNTQKKITKNPFDATPLGILKNTITGIPDTINQVFTPKKKSMEFRVGEGLNPEQKKVAEEKVRTIDYGIPEKPLTFGESLEIQKSQLADQIAKKRGVPSIDPRFVPSPELRRQALETTVNPVMGVSSGLEKTRINLAGKASPQLLEYLAKEKSAPKIETELNKLGIQPEVSKVYAPKLANTNTIDEVKNVLINEPIVTKQSEIQKKILKAREEQGLFEKKPLPEPSVDEYPTQVNEVRNIIKENALPEKIQSYKDIGNLKKQGRDIYRNTQEVFGKDFPIINEKILQPFNQSKGNLIDFYNTNIENLGKNVIDKYKIHPGSKESAAIELFGEGKKTYQDLIKEFGETKANQIVEADKFFRQQYDDLIDQINKVEMQIYPNNPAKWTPKLQNYYRHGHDLKNNFSRLQNILDNPIRIDPTLVGISEGTKPKTKWASFKQRRLGQTTKPDAVGGFLDYIKSAGYAIHIDPNIGKFRELADSLARATHQTKNLNNYIYNLQMFANQLAGKTPELDRIVAEHIPGGRTTLNVIDWVNNRVKSNTILGNVSASLSQIYNIPQGIADTGIINSTKGLSKTLGQLFVENKAMQKSDFIKERYFNKFDKFDKGILNNTKKFTVWMVSAVDELATKFIWNSEYTKAIQEGIDNPIQHADDMTRKLVGGRGIGEKALVQNSKVFQLIAPFQLEVTNLWWVMEDLAKGNKSIMGKFGAFAKLFLTLYLFNNLIQNTTGNRIALDPIQMTKDGIDELKQGNYGKAGGRVFGEFLSNVPGGQTLASMYPEFGTTIGGTKIPTRKELFGRNDPTRFGSGLLTVKGVQDPVYKLLFPFGGGQVKKTLTGLSAYEKGKSTTTKGSQQYKIDKTTENLIKASLFGKTATTNAQKYYNKKTKQKTKSTKNPFD